ncbi:uncharacterized protein LOC125552704 [Triticum urartu]|uniref:uncharacterized protein LOC125552702 n=1 Tax=Triticum urartu TaxID=4572 RepID=UPI002044B4C2|nr:uncharacterized protein LOC125552702 [Triticum urartu]XP_048572310.1 uncharacterized protein LOC125552702 [Triticum urartu]XP_048572311.1 uncharacterized protein LOC125552702 [Triticum urartu]XP_048572312.1 uncharacterized protein LOC125552702 [Triticum urartu]XP_048572313.1 uncharacterized protein LOC125552702 [Triticum urartu]XP_048572314.1 uncharacterized protein LOC125552702 [Triticum urartu]XP_048572315.1 uncharacterized protein LOC125552702 [Triticum urartu]XP_048572316.1 uncharacte
MFNQNIMFALTSVGCCFSNIVCKKWYIDMNNSYSIQRILQYSTAVHGEAAQPVARAAVHERRRDGPFCCSPLTSCSRIWSLSYDSTPRLCSLELTVLLCWTGRRGPACCRYKPSRWTASAKSFAVSADICQLARRLKAHRLASINWWCGLDDAEVVIFAGPVTAYAYSFNFSLLLVL